MSNTDDHPQADPLLGQTFARRYLIERRLGRGGMGVVYEALHETIARRVAIKLLNGETAHKPDVIQRFFNEALATNMDAGFVRIDLHRHVTDDVFIDLGLALKLGNDGTGCVQFEHHIMRLAVLGDLVGERAQTPGLRLHDLAAILFDDIRGICCQRVHLGLSQILTRKEYVLVKSHNACLSWPIAAVRPMRPTLRLSSIPFREAGRR